MVDTSKNIIIYYCVPVVFKKFILGQERNTRVCLKNKQYTFLHTCKADLAKPKGSPL